MEEDKDPLALQKENEEDQKRRRAELGQPRRPEPMGLGMNPRTRSHHRRLRHTYLLFPGSALPHFQPDCLSNSLVGSRILRISRCLIGLGTRTVLSNVGCQGGSQIPNYESASKVEIEYCH